MMATEAPIPDLFEDSKPAAIQKEVVQINTPTKDSVVNLEKDLAEVSEKREPAPTKFVAKGGKNALLARVQVAQERARLAQEAKKKAFIELENARLEEERILRGLGGEMKDEKDNADASLNSDLFETLNNSEHLLLNPESKNSANPRTTQDSPAVAPQANDTTASNPPPPPHEESAKIEEDFAAFQLDEDGNSLSFNEKRRMLQEQEEILRKIQQEKEANDNAIAELTGCNVSAVTLPTNPDGSQTTVEIAPNKRVALHGRGRTEAAIADGTAVLVQCVYCQNWMQVTPSATLMFCPVCQVVSPVQHQDNVMTTEEAIRMSLDRKMAEKLQNQFYIENEEDEAKETENDMGIMDKLKTSFWGNTEEAVLVTPKNSDKQQSWGQYFSSLVPGTAEEFSDVPNRGSAEITISKQPPVKLTPKVYGSNYPVDGYDAERSSLLPGRVAESKPLFSCIADQVSNIITGQPDEVPEEVHGVDSSDLLVVSQIRKDEDGSGAYASLGSKDKL